MTAKKKIISRELNEQLRSVTFTPDNPILDKSVFVEPALIESVTPVTIPKKEPAKPAALNKRVVTVEYLDKLEKATIAETRYESIKGFSHLLSNVSIVLLSVSIITYLILYLINPQMLSLIALLILSLEAFTLLGVTLYTMSKTSTFKELSDLAASDLSTCSHIIGNPRGEVYFFPGAPNEESSPPASSL